MERHITANQPVECMLELPVFLLVVSKCHYLCYDA